MNENQTIDETNDLEEVAVAAWGPEADIWVRVLGDIGIKATTEIRGNWFTQILYLGRRPMAVLVPSRDHLRATARLKELRLIQ